MEKKKYELMVILKPLLPQDIRAKVEDRLKKILKETGKGSIVKSDVWGKKHLAYPIGGHEDGYYIVYEIEMDPTGIEEANKKMGLISEYMRFMFVAK